MSGETYFFTHAAFAAHETPSGHPECSERAQAVDKALATPAFEGLVRKTPPLGETALIKRVHPDAYLSLIEEAGERVKAGGLTQLDPDTTMGPSSAEAALRAVGGACAGVDAVFAGEAKNAFVAARPPGHHAEPTRAMGFCLFNTAAIAAHHTRAAHGAERIAVVDFDVHHGNGTEAAFWHDEAAFFASSHEWPQYPGTGRETDRGASANIANAPLPTGTTGDEFRRAWGEALLPALSDFDPDVIIISAGFDAHAHDPLGGFQLLEEDFAWVTAEILGLAADKCAGRVVSVLEGGYDLEALGRSAAAHVAVLQDA